MISDQELKRAMTIAAKIIHLYGDQYWPIFDRLEIELKQRNDRQRKLENFLANSEHPAKNASKQYH